jgi:hypothetical protein
MITRSLVGAAFPLFSTQMFVNLGINWAGTLLGGIALILTPIPFLFYKYGSRIRTKSCFAPCVDLKVAKFLEEEKLAAAEREEQGEERPQSRRPHCRRSITIDVTFSHDLPRSKPTFVAYPPLLTDLYLYFMSPILI